MYVIQRNDGTYVSPAGLQSSYTRLLQDARVFATREQAERERCQGNERIVSCALAFNNATQRHSEGALRKG